MRILHISSAQAFGGGERYLADLANALVARGHDVFAVLRPDSPLVSELTSLPASNLVYLPLRNSLDAHSAGKLASFVKKNKIQLIHAHMARDYPLAAYACRRNPDARLIVTRHVLFPLNRLHRITLSRVARVVAVSDAVGRQLLMQKVIPRELVTVIHNGIDIDRFDKAKSEFDRRQFCNRWDVPEKGILIGSVGSLNPLKGHEQFLQAAALLTAQYPDAFFIVAGIDVTPGQINRANLERVIRELKLETKFRFIGKMDDVAPLFCALDIFVSASHSESFGLVIAEAMATETPIVATETEGAKEILRNGETGLLVKVRDVPDLANAIGKLLADEELRLRIGRRAGEEVRRRFTLEKMVNATEQVYQESVNQKPGLPEKVPAL
ncbi:MAG TPA: glycosyltransferase family 4 protein [Pyrinomonadaceae bacterium]|nr:glycosyltransferase family 4 protein [Pyrinomonadaceae bacterium]